MSLLAYAAIALAAAQAGQDTAPPAAPSAEVTQEQDVVVIQARPRSAPGDPFLATNAKSFAVTQLVDEAFTAPASLAYKHAVPDAVRDGLRNFLNNTRERVVFLNFLLQLNPARRSKRWAASRSIRRSALPACSMSPRNARSTCPAARTALPTAWAITA